MDPVPTTQTRPTGFKGAVFRVRAFFSFRSPSADYVKPKPKLESNRVSAADLRVQALALQKSGDALIEAGQFRDAAAKLGEAAFLFGQTDSRDDIILSCQLLSKAARQYFKVDDLGKAKSHYTAAYDLATLWRLPNLAEHYQKMASEITSLEQLWLP